MPLSALMTIRSSPSILISLYLACTARYTPSLKARRSATNIDVRPWFADPTLITLPVQFRRINSSTVEE